MQPWATSDKKPKAAFNLSLTTFGSNITATHTDRKNSFFTDTLNPIDSIHSINPVPRSYQQANTLSLTAKSSLRYSARNWFADRPVFRFSLSRSKSLQHDQCNSEQLRGRCKINITCHKCQSGLVGLKPYI